MTQTSGIATIRPRSEPVVPLTASGAPVNMAAVREAYSRRAAAAAFANARREARARAR